MCSRIAAWAAGVGIGREREDATVSRLDEIEARLAKATPGPWQVDRTMTEVFTMNEGGFGGPICEVGDPYPRGINHPQENMTLIAHAPTDLRDLVEVAKVAKEIYLHGASASNMEALAAAFVAFEQGEAGQ